MATLVTLIAVLTSILAHEKAHQYVMDRLGYLPGPIQWHWYGPSVRSGVPMRRSADIARVALAGPLAGMLVASCLYATRIDALVVAAWWAMAINLCQLIPWEPLDGGLIMRALPPECLALFPAAILAWLVSIGHATSIAGVAIMWAVGAAAIWRMASWQRYTKNVYLRIDDGELNAVRHKWASYSVPISTRMGVSFIYMLLVGSGLLWIR